LDFKKKEKRVREKIGEVGKIRGKGRKFRKQEKIKEKGKN